MREQRHRLALAPAPPQSSQGASARKTTHPCTWEDSTQGSQGRSDLKPGQIDKEAKSLGSSCLLPTEPQNGSGWRGLQFHHPLRLTQGGCVKVTIKIFLFWG